MILGSVAACVNVNGGCIAGFNESIPALLVMRLVPWNKLLNLLLVMLWQLCGKTIVNGVPKPNNDSHQMTMPCHEF